MKIKNFLFAGIISSFAIGFCLQANASANVAIDAPPLSDQVSSAIMLEHSRPTIYILEISADEAKQVGYFFEAKKDKLFLRQYRSVMGPFKRPVYDSFKVSMSEVVPFGVVVEDTDWERFKSTVLSVDVDNCLDCALYEKTKDPYKLKDHLVSLRSFTAMVQTLNTRKNYALKQSAYNRLMQSDKEFGNVREKAKANGFKLCPVVPDDYPGMDLGMYISKVQKHMNVVEEKMKSALQ